MKGMNQNKRFLKIYMKEYVTVFWNLDLFEIVKENKQCRTYLQNLMIQTVTTEYEKIVLVKICRVNESNDRSFRSNDKIICFHFDFPITTNYNNKNHK